MLRKSPSDNEDVTVVLAGEVYTWLQKQATGKSDGKLQRRSEQNVSVDGCGVRYSFVLPVPACLQEG